ncbi:hypothetical protein DICVIV_12687 [Dictyocaulus viviparus]|uniref:Uncharacterized protein n=1 Tax=Dictyocaulus viviparus TaxID=29172 RepID=A0A0D8XG41_DICVI|nr:hypothetical protein DICVIV_12687 [Dictyocaulus viviparus]
MGCTFRVQLNDICSIWYSTLILCLQSYLIYLGFERHKLYTEMKWPANGYPHTWLTVYMILYTICIPLSLLLFSFGFFKSGNIAGDNEKLANREDRVIELFLNRKGEKPDICSVHFIIMTIFDLWNVNGIRVKDIRGYTSFRKGLK